TRQVEKAFEGIAPHEFFKIVIAYEPIWAIGTGKTATAPQADIVCALIRELIAKKYDKFTASRLRILYGGSMKPDNAKELLAQYNIDGGLIGGASLVAEDFAKIVAAAE
ncbi:MAG: triose-phosphate isomerase, partial [Oscillospiraceae bacterium]